jgi:single-stranded-DNA-specific exonuclease
MRPVFITRNVQDYQGNSRIVKEQHIKFVLHQNSRVVIDGIGFNLAEKFPIVNSGPFDVVYTLDENEFNGVTRLQMKVVDVRKAG